MDCKNDKRLEKRIRFQFFFNSTGIQDEEYEKLLKKVNRFVYNYEGADNESEYVRNHPEKFVFDEYYDEIE